MRERVREWIAAVTARMRRFERREIHEFRQWIEHTGNLIHLSVLVFVPLLIALVTWLSNAVDALPFLLFPPLASGTYTLFADPESEYASPIRFVAGLTTGALCGWLAMSVTGYLWVVRNGEVVHPGAAAFSVLLTGLVTWLANVEEASAFSSALLVLVVDLGNSGPVTLGVVGGVSLSVTPPLGYVLSVLLSSSIVAAIFLVWRREFFERRGRFLYQSTSGDDQVLVPMRTDSAPETAALAATLAAAHDAGKVVLFDVVDDQRLAEARATLRDADGVGSDDAELGDATAQTASEPDADDSPMVTKAVDAESLADDVGGESVAEATADRATATTATRLEDQAAAIERDYGVPCQVVVAAASESPAETVRRAAVETNCDLIATPYETADDAPSPFVRNLLRGEIDVLVHRSRDGRTSWDRILVLVRSPSDVAHAMIDFALRLTDASGRVSVSHCVDGGNRRRAESMLANLVDQFDGPIETRIARDPVESFLADQSGRYDLIVLGASMDRSTASRLVSPPTFERIGDVDCDVCIVDRNYR